MATGQLNRVIHHLQRSSSSATAPPLSDAALLERFVQFRDEAAFEEIMRRHGPMVLGVCRRVLGDVLSHDVEDAFQSTFLVLVKKAASVRPREMVGNWLYGVASLTAMKARALAARRILKEKNAMPRLSTMTDPLWQDVQPVLDEELRRLPDKYRAALVFCDLEGQSRRDAAARLKLPEGTLSSRLTVARRMLAKRLERRGITLSVAVLAGLISQNLATAAVPSAFTASTMKAVSALTLGNGAGVISTNVATLTKGVLGAMFIAKIKVAMILVVGMGILVGSVSLVASWQNSAADSAVAQSDPIEPQVQQPGNLQAEMPARVETNRQTKDEPPPATQQQQAQVQVVPEEKKPKPLGEDKPKENAREPIKHEKKLAKGKDRLKRPESQSNAGFGVRVTDGVVTVTGPLDRANVVVESDSTGTRVTVSPRVEPGLPVPVPSGKLEPKTD